MNRLGSPLQALSRRRWNSRMREGRSPVPRAVFGPPVSARVGRLRSPILCRVLKYHLLWRSLLASEKGDPPRFTLIGSHYVKTQCLEGGFHE